MIYPEKFITAALIKMNSEELEELGESLWTDWLRVTNALKVVQSMEEEK